MIVWFFIAWDPPVAACFSCAVKQIVQSDAPVKLRVGNPMEPDCHYCDGSF